MWDVQDKLMVKCQLFILIFLWNVHLSGICFSHPPVLSCCEWNPFRIVGTSFYKRRPSLLLRTFSMHYICHQIINHQRRIFQERSTKIKNKNKSNSIPESLNFLCFLGFSVFLLFPLYSRTLEGKWTANKYQRFLLFSSLFFPRVSYWMSCRTRWLSCVFLPPLPLK